jgi:hypothetical protein
LAVAVRSAEPDAHMLEECAAAYGPDLLAYLLGAGADGPLEKWRLESEGASARLRACHRVLHAFADARLARAWMRRPSARLGGHTAAWAVRAGEADLLAAVEREARSAPEASG